MNPTALARAIAPAVLAVLLTEGRPLASGPLFPTTRFWSSWAPSEPLDRYLAGHLGILEPTFGTPYLYVAYRHLSGLGLDADSRTAVADWFATPPPPVAAYNTWARWQEARRKVVNDYSNIAAWREYTKKVGHDEYRLQYLNCLEDALVTATNTLNDRMARWGADSREVRAWVAAQDQVFSNCGQGESIPEPLSDDADALARADRVYQIAAAHFYAGHFGEAQRLFRLIAADEASPWRRLAAYLVARAMLREAVLSERVNVEELRATEAYLRELLSDSSLADVHPAARRLLDLVRIESDPAARRRELAATLTHPSLEPPLRPILADYLWILFRYHYGDEPTPDNDELSDWLVGDQAPERWRERRSLPWLVAAMMRTPVTRDDLLEATKSVDTASPAYRTLAYYRARHLAEKGRRDDARSEIDRLLKEQGADLALGDRNRLLSLRTQLAANVTEFFRSAELVPVDVGLNFDGHFESRGFEEFRGRPLLDYCSTAVLDRDFTPRMLLDVLRREELTKYLQRRLAVAAWTRALLTDETDTAAELAPLVADLVPELRAETDAFLAAPLGEARQFAMALVLLRFPGAQPDLRRPVGRVTPIGAASSLRDDNWWCHGRFLVARETAEQAYLPEPSCGSDWWRAVTLKSPPPPGFLTAEERAAAARMREKLQALDPAAVYLGRIVLGWARAHPSDERVPEALHRLVQAAHLGCPVQDDGTVAKAAFQLLHRRYPDSPWAAQTKYWYR